MRVFRDWMSLLNSGHRITPIGSSDSHEVSAKIVGQGRTYIACDDSNPGEIDVAAAVDSLIAGRVSVCLGLLTRIRVDGRHGPGSMVKPGGELRVEVEVLGPSWSRPARVELFSNGSVIRQATIEEKDGGRAGSKWKHTWTIPRPTHDVHLSAAATGLSNAFPFHPIARTYQPVTPDWKPYLFGSSGAVRIDGDRNGKWSSPREQATLLADSVEDSLDAVFDKLEKYDQAVATQAAAILDSRGVEIGSKQALLKLASKAAHVRRGYQAYLDAKRRSREARATAGR
jgi:hypothetical protein